MLGTLFIVSAPSGGGKTSLIKAASNLIDDIVISISCTTRPKRGDEQEGVNYYYITPEEFQMEIQKQAFLEYANVFNHFYGTPRNWVETQLEQGIDIFLDIDWQGARQVKAIMPESVSIYLLPPSKEVLLRRLQQRKRDETAIIKDRMKQIKEQVMHCTEFDYILVNDDFEKTLMDLCKVVTVQRLKGTRQLKKNQKLIESLLAD